MQLFDLILVAILAGFTLFGFGLGLVGSAGSLAGTVLGVYLASRWYVGLALWLQHLTGWSQNVVTIISFVIVFLIINRLIGLVFYLVDRIFSIITRLPIISGINRMLGGVFGLLEGIVVVGISVYIISRFPLSPRFMTIVAESKVASWCARAASLLWPLVPETIQVLKNMLESTIQ